MYLSMDNDVFYAFEKAGFRIHDRTLLTCDITMLYRSNVDINKIAYFDMTRAKRLLSDEEGCPVTDEEVNSRPLRVYSYNKSKLTKYAIAAKPGRVARRLFPEASDKMIESFVYEFIVLDNDAKFQIYTDVTEVYADCYADSCMTGSDMGFYRRNGVKCLVLKRGDKKVARALMWPDVYFPSLDKTLTFVDRVYARDYKDEALFGKYCMENDLVIGYGSEFTYKGIQFNDTIKYTLKDYSSDQFWPYADTLRYWDGCRVLSNRDGNYILESTDGQCPTTQGEWSDYYDDYIPYDEAVYSEYRGDYLFREDAINLGWDWALPQDVFECKCCGRTDFKDNRVFTYDEQECCDNCVTRFTAGCCDGEWYMKDDENAVLTHDGYVVHVDDTTFDDESGEYYMTEEYKAIHND